MRGECSCPSSSGAGCATWPPNPVWRTPQALFTHALAHGGGYQAHLNLAAAFPNRQSHASSSTSRMPCAWLPRPTRRLGSSSGFEPVEYLRRDVEQGLDVIRQVVAERPHYSLYLFGLGEALAFVGRPRQALPHRNAP